MLHSDAMCTTGFGVSLTIQWSNRKTFSIKSLKSTRKPLESEEGPDRCIYCRIMRSRQKVDSMKLFFLNDRDIQDQRAQVYWWRARGFNAFWGRIYFSPWWWKQFVALPEKVMQAGTLTAFKKYLNKHLNCQGNVGYSWSCGKWDWYW